MSENRWIWGQKTKFFKVLVSKIKVYEALRCCVFEGGDDVFTVEVQAECLSTFNEVFRNYIIHYIYIFIGRKLQGPLNMNTCLILFSVFFPAYHHLFINWMKTDQMNPPSPPSAISAGAASAQPQCSTLGLFGSRGLHLHPGMPTQCSVFI